MQIMQEMGRVLNMETFLLLIPLSETSSCSDIRVTFADKVVKKHAAVVFFKWHYEIEININMVTTECIRWQAIALCVCVCVRLLVCPSVCAQM